MMKLLLAHKEILFLLLLVVISSVLAPYSFLLHCSQPDQIQVVQSNADKSGH